MLFDPALPFPPANNATDPWQFSIRLNRIIGANNTAAQLVDEFLTLLLAVPEIEAVWYGQADQDGQIIGKTAKGAFGEVFSDLAYLAAIANDPTNPGLTSRAWHSGEPQFSAHWRHDPNYAQFTQAARGLAWESAAAVPLKGLNGPIGLIGILSNKPGFFPASWSADTLRQFAAVLGNALENRAKHVALQRAELLYRTLFQTAGLMLNARSEAELLKKLCKMLVQDGLFVSATIGAVEADSVYRNKVGVSQAHARLLRHDSTAYEPGGTNRPLSLDCWETSKILVANNYAKRPLDAATRHMANKVGIGSAACLPIFRNGQRWAVISVTATQAHFFDAPMLALLEQMAAMAGRRLDELDAKAALLAERMSQSRLARQDHLTGLPNRLAFDEHLAASMARAIRHKNIAGIGVIDIDRFNQFTENWGQAAADAIICEVAIRLRQVLREVDFVARIGGDDFALVLEDWSWTHDIEGLCARLHDVLNAPIDIAGVGNVQITISAGFTLFPMDNADPPELLRHAEMALYAARAGRGLFDKFWCLYMDIAAGTKERFAGRKLLSQGALTVHYQPVMNLRSGKIVSLEALARLDDGKRLIMPGSFLRDLMLDDRVMLFHQVLKTALAQIKSWDYEGVCLNISVNVDAQILLLDRTLPYIAQVLQETEIKPSRLVLEILETHDFADLAFANRQLAAIRALGVRIALDDVGTGYSSILKIRELPLDIVKLDRSFIAGLAQQPDDLMFVSVLQTLTRSLGMDLVVEGVESDDVMDALRMVGAQQAQGYCITRPMSAAQLSVWLRAFQPVEQSREPKALLGAYAVHLTWLRAFQFVHTQKALLAHLRTHDPFPLKQFLVDHDYYDRPLGLAYQALQAILHDEETNRESIIKASDRFRAELITAIAG